MVLFWTCLLGFTALGLAGNIPLPKRDLAAAPEGRLFACGTLGQAPDLQHFLKHHDAQSTNFSKRTTTNNSNNKETYSVKTYIHHLEPRSGWKKWLADAFKSFFAAKALEAEIYGVKSNDDTFEHAMIQKLNDAFGEHGFAFVLAGVQTIESDLASFDVGYDAKRYRSLTSWLRKGSYDALNLYFHDEVVVDGDIVAGFCRWPDGNKARDGCHIGSGFRVNQFSTTVHEVGHWLDLMHTFEGGCGSRGDAVADTQAHSLDLGWLTNSFRTGWCLPIGGCENSLGPGIYPAAENYMNYLAPHCRSQFTPGQGERMRRAYRYRRFVSRNS